MKPLRIYVDTSVIGGCLDDKFTDDSRALLELARQGRVRLVVSDLIVNEIVDAPVNVREVFDSLLATHPETAIMNRETVALQQEYLKARVVGPASADDAHHVAIATVWHADVIASWNFKHLVHVDKIRGFNAVNQRMGHYAIDIRTPTEIV